MKLPVLLSLILSMGGLRAEQLAITLTGSAQPNCWDVEEIVAEVTKNAKSDREKVLALHRFGMAHFIHYDGPIEERSEYVTDPVKLLGVYGFALCGNNSCAMNALYNAAGLKARVRSVPGHAIPEIWFEEKWNYIDTDMFGYVYLPDGRIASVDELVRDPDLFMRQKNPPNPFYPFDKKEDMASVFRNAAPRTNCHPYTNAHMMNLAARTGESVTMYYRPQGRHVLTELRRDIGTEYKDYWLVGPVRKGSLAWCDRPPAAYGNGRIEYKPDLRSEAFRLENPEQQGVAVRRERRSPPLAAARSGDLASLIVEVNSPWVIVGKQNDLTNFEDDSDAAVVSGLFWRAGADDENRILVSTDAGRTWTKVWENRLIGAVPFRVDLSRHVNNRYAYRVKFEWLDRKGTGRVGLEGLEFDTWVELSPMGLPRIAPGRNTFWLSTRPRRTFHNESVWQRGQNLPGQRLENLASSDSTPYLRPQQAGSPGALTFRLGPEGPVEEARISVLARTLPGGKPSDVSVLLQLSVDAGGTWEDLRHFTPDPEHQVSGMWVNHVVKNRVLPGSRTLLRVSVSGGGLEKVIANSAVRAEPRSPAALRITHVWRAGDKQQLSGNVFQPGIGPRSYEVVAPESGIVNESLRIEGIAPGRP